MRPEGFISLLACVLVLFLIGVGAAAFKREMRGFTRSVPPAEAPSSPP